MSRAPANELQQPLTAQPSSSYFPHKDAGSAIALPNHDAGMVADAQKRFPLSTEVWDALKVALSFNKAVHPKWMMQVALIMALAPFAVNIGRASYTYKEFDTSVSLTMDGCYPTGSSSSFLTPVEQCVKCNGGTLTVQATVSDRAYYKLFLSIACNTFTFFVFAHVLVTGYAFRIRCARLLVLTVYTKPREFVATAKFLAFPILSLLATIGFNIVSMVSLAHALGDVPVGHEWGCSDATINGTYVAYFAPGNSGVAAIAPPETFSSIGWAALSGAGVYVTVLWQVYKLVMNPYDSMGIEQLESKNSCGAEVLRHLRYTVACKDVDHWVKVYLAESSVPESDMKGVWAVILRKPWSMFGQWDEVLLIKQRPAVPGGSVPAPQEHNIFAALQIVLTKCQEDGKLVAFHIDAEADSSATVEMRAPAAAV